MSENENKTVVPFPTAAQEPLKAPGPTEFGNMLRNLAENVDRGEYGDVREGVLIIAGNQLEIFGLGTEDGTVAHYLMCCGAHKIQQAFVEQGVRV